MILSRRDFVRAAGLSVAALAAGPSASAAATRSLGLITARSRPVQQPGLLIRSGTIVTAESSFPGDVRIRGAEIVEIGNRLAPDGERLIDAGGLLALPGGIDPHAHLTQDESTPPQYRVADDLLSGSQAALAGGVTTIGNMSFPVQGQTLFEAIERDEWFVEQKAIAEIMLHPVLRDPTQLSDEGIADLVQAGHTSIKIFMVSAAYDQNVREYVRVMRRAGAAGILNVIHCEDPTIIAEATLALVSSGKESLRHYADSRPLAAEIVATRRAIAYSEATGAPVYFVHLSAAQPLQICREAQAAGTPVYVETRPVYLHLTAESYSSPSGPLYVAQPPLRTANDILALWEGLADGAVHTLGTDHVGWSLEQKMDPSLTIEDLRPGVPNLQEMLPMLYSEGVVSGRISQQRFVAITAANPAKLFGLYPRKGTIAIGSDADIALWDPTETREIELVNMFSRSGFSLFDGWEVTGWPQMTIRRGEVVYENGRIESQPGSGRLLRRGTTRSP